MTNPKWQEVEDNMGLVHMTANRMRSRLATTDMMQYEDLVSEGTFGLLYAVEHFDPSLGFHFSSYAVKTIRGYMLQGHRRLFKEQWDTRSAGVKAYTFSLDQENDEYKTEIGDDGEQAEATEEYTHRHIFWNRVLDALTPLQRERIELLLQGLEPAEVARKLGVSGQAVRITYNKAVKRAKALVR